MFVVLVTLVFVSLANVIMLEGVVKVWIRLRLVGLKVCVGLKRECSSQALRCYEMEKIKISIKFQNTTNFF